MSGLSETLTSRVERCLDRWNALPRQPRSELSNDVTAASIALGNLMTHHRALRDAVDALEQRLAVAEEAHIEAMGNEGEGGIE